jgi:uncharacterized protein (DUF302 family)
MKTIILFVFGLLSWLLLTNYQLVYSKVANFTNPVQESVKVISSAETNANSVIEDNITQEEISTLESEVIEKTTDKVVELSNNEELSEESEKNLEITKAAATPKIESETELENAAEVAPDTKKEVEQEINTETAANNTVTTSQVPMNHPWIPPNSTMPMFNQNMMNPNMYMNPMAMMMPMMMGMMGPMMNPNAMMNHPINTMTHPQNMNAMMMSMDPKMMFSMFGQPSKEYQEGKVPDQLPVVTIPGMPTQTYQYWPKNTVTPATPREAKHHAFQTAMAMSPLSMRSMVSMMADKIPVDEGVSWDDAVEAMKLRANEVNFKFVGSSPLWKQIEAETEQPSAKVEMFRFCDARMARKILDEVPEFIVFLPCKIALLEDGEGKLWVMTLDWDVSWMDYAQNPNNHLSKDIREHAQLIRKNIQYIMEGAATGDFYISFIRF